MNKLKFVLDYISILFLLCISLHLKEIRFAPHHEGIDPKLSSYVNRWMDLAKTNHIEFKKTVSIGFKKINQDNAVGMCYYGRKFREIDIDPEYWSKIDFIGKTVLVWHELDHCYCNRDHDFAKGKVYPKPKDGKMPNKDVGYYPDKCPLSIMHPIVVDDMCFIIHSDDYVREQFERCVPY